MSACQGCGAQIPPSRGGPARQWCSEVCRKRTRYGVTCPDCGYRSNGSSGSKESTACARCATWTAEQAIAALQEWHAEHGRSPTEVAARGSSGAIPTERTVRRLFGSWNNGLLAAGLPLRWDRRPETQARIEQLHAAGVPLPEVARRVGLSEATVRNRMYRRGLRLRQPRHTETATTGSR